MEDFLTLVYAILAIVVITFGIFFSIGGMRINMAEDNVSGVVYNTSNNSWPGGNTHFSVRASEDTYVSEENKSSYCLPGNSPYVKLVNEAAKDKNIKVNVTTGKQFKWVFPWVCTDNVKVEQIKE